jgi:hypothetical protein
MALHSRPAWVVPIVYTWVATVHASRLFVNCWSHNNRAKLSNAILGTESAVSQFIHKRHNSRNSKNDYRDACIPADRRMVAPLAQAAQQAQQDHMEP